MSVVHIMLGPWTPRTGNRLQDAESAVVSTAPARVFNVKTDKPDVFVQQLVEQLALRHVYDVSHQETRWRVDVLFSQNAIKLGAAVEEITELCYEITSATKALR